MMGGQRGAVSKRITAVVAGCWLGCSSGPPRVATPDAFGLDLGTNRVWVQGPWHTIQPSTDVDEVIDQLCPAVMTLPRAKDRDYGQEYCGLIYSLGNGIYHASVASPLGETVLVGPHPRKTCTPPRRVVDGRGRAVPLADYHSHPWAPSPMSVKDLKSDSQRWSIRIQFDTACHVQKLVPHADEPLPGEVYRREGKRWKLVGLIKLEDKARGRITAVNVD